MSLDTPIEYNYFGTMKQIMRELGHHVAMGAFIAGCLLMWPVTAYVTHVIMSAMGFWN